MTTDLVTVDRDTSLDEILSLLVDGERDINRLPVVNGDGLVGIVVREDVLRAIRDERRTDRAA